MSNCPVMRWILNTDGLGTALGRILLMASGALAALASTLTSDWWFACGWAFVTLVMMAGRQKGEHGHPWAFRHECKAFVGCMLLTTAALVLGGGLGEALAPRPGIIVGFMLGMTIWAFIDIFREYKAE